MLNKYESEIDLINRNILDPAIIQFENLRNFIPKALLLQWHITEKCNLSCSHCYQDNSLKSVELSLEAMKSVLDQYISMLKRFKIKGHINFTGGEPFLSKDFFPLLEYLSQYREYAGFAVLSNGTMLDKESVLFLKKMNCAFVQVSVEGNQETHNSIRGKDNWSKVSSALKLMDRHRLNSHVSFTVHKKNYLQVKEVVRLVKKAKGGIIWSDRLIPMGHGKPMESLMLEPDHVKEFFDIFYKEKIRLDKKWFSSTSIKMNRALQFIPQKEKNVNCGVYGCNAGRGLVTILADGTLVPCRRMPVAVGSLLNRDLYTLYKDSIFFLHMRSSKNIPVECGECNYRMKCRGGLKCLSYALYKDPFKPDPQCFKLYKNLNIKERLSYEN